MVAEPVAETGLPEVSEQTAPNPTETVVETPAVEVEETLPEDILALLNEEPGSEGGTDAATQGETQKGPRTEAEIEAAVVQKLQAQGQTQAKAAQIAGVRQSFQAMDADLQSLQVELDRAYNQGDNATVIDVQRRMKNRIDQHNGHWNTLYHNDVLEAHTLGGNDVRKGIHEAVFNQLGKDDYNDLVGKHQEFDPFLADYAERYAKKKGWMPKAEVKAAETKAHLKAMKVFEQITGVKLPRGGEGERLPGARSNGGRGLTLQQIDNMPTSEWMGLGDAATRADILAKARERAGR